MNGMSFSAVRVGGIAAKLKRRAKIKLKARAVLHKDSEERDASDIDSVVALTNRSSFFFDMDKQLQRDICKALQIDTFPPHTIVMKQGDIPTFDARFYIVLTGQVSIYQQDSQQVQQVEENEGDSRPTSRHSSRPASRQQGGKEAEHGAFRVRLGAGQHFGQRALLSQEPRSATVVTYKTKTELLYLRRKDYDRLLATRDRKLLNEVKDALLACLSDGGLPGGIGEIARKEHLQQLTYYVEWATAEAGEAIAQQDAPADRLIFLVQGQAFVQHTVRKQPVGKLEVASISTLGDHSTYGASEFIRPVPLGQPVPTYKMTLRASVPCRYLFLSRVHLSRLQKTVSRALVKCATIGVMRQLFWFHRLAMYKQLPGHEASFNTVNRLPETHEELFHIVQQAMRQASQKDITLVKRVGPQAHKVSSLAHHAWPFKNHHPVDVSKHHQRKKSKSIAASFEQMYKDDVNMTWQKTKRKSQHLQQHSPAHQNMHTQKLQQLVADMCAAGRFELLQSAADDAARMSATHVPGGVINAGLQSANELLCYSPVKATQTHLNRIKDRESELEAELKGLDAMLQARGYSAPQREPSPVEDLDIGATGSIVSSRQRLLRPHVPHVLHDLPLIFPRAKQYRPSASRTLPPIATRHKLHVVPESFKVLWPKIHVEVSWLALMLMCHVPYLCLTIVFVFLSFCGVLTCIFSISRSQVPFHRNAAPELLGLFVNSLSEELQK